MDAAIMSKVDTWLNGNYDQATKNEIIRLKNESPDELTEGFYRSLEFGTGGMRGLMAKPNGTVLPSPGFLRVKVRV